MRNTAIIVSILIMLCGAWATESVAFSQGGAYNGAAASSGAEASTAELDSAQDGPPYGHGRRGPGPRALRKMPVKAVAPYGDFCTLCSKYGMGRRAVPQDQAVGALVHYFANRGLHVKNIREGVRFMKADIYKGDELVDRIVFDRVTGRIRSIY